MTTRRKFLIILPFVQVVIAFALITNNSLRPIPVGEDTLPDSRSSALDIQYCWALNSPAAMIAHLLRAPTNELFANHYPILPIVNWSIFLSLVWVLWYGVGIEIGGKGRSVLTPKTGARRVADVLAIAFGVSLIAYADRATVSVYHQTRVSSVHVVWVLAIVGFYGHDLWASFRPSRNESVGNAPVR